MRFSPPFPGSPRFSPPILRLVETSLIIMFPLSLALIAFAPSSGVAAEAPLTVHVLVLNYDPVVHQHGNQRLHEACRWNDPRRLAVEYAADVTKSSHGIVRYRLVEWRDLDEFPQKTDGFRYTVAGYLNCLRTGKGWHKPDGVDYPKLVLDNGVTALVDARRIDELWIFGGPYFGFWEAAMVGPEAFTINGGVYDNVPCKRRFAVMGFSYERGVAEMLHDLCHRIEATLSRVYGGWQVDELTTTWARFTANARQSHGEAAVGTCHYPPNARKDYDYANPREVLSSADDWLHYPRLTGAKTPVSGDTWGGPDYQRNYMNWWFAHLPHAPGTNPTDGKFNNWWKYVFGYNAGHEQER